MISEQSATVRSELIYTILILGLLGNFPLKADDRILSTGSISDGAHYLCNLKVISYKPPPDDEQYLICQWSERPAPTFTMICFLDIATMKLQKRTDNPSFYYACPVRAPIPFVDGEGVDMECEYIPEQDRERQRARLFQSYIVRGKDPYTAPDVPEMVCTARKFSIPWEAVYGE
jgi:hypothetical protein